jgi:dCTP diphosphatase
MRQNMADILDIEKIKNTLEEFATARDWNKFHNPKNLSMSLACEAGELLEIFRWMPEAETAQAFQDPVLKEKIAHELADISINLIRLASLMQVNLSQALEEKMAIINERYPVAQVKGSCKKYTEY